MTESVLPQVAAAPAHELPVERALLHERIADPQGVRVVARLGRALLVWFAVLVVYGQTHPVSNGELLALTGAAAVWLLALHAAAPLGHLVLSPPVATAAGSGIGFLIVGVLSSSPVGLHASVAVLAALTVAVFCSAVVWDWFVAHTSAGRRRVLLVGVDAVGDELVEEVKNSHRRGLDVVAAIPGAPDLAAVVEAKRPDVVVLMDESAYCGQLDSLLEARSSVRVTSVASFFEQWFGRVPIERLTNAWFMCLLHPRQHVYSRLAKRTFDLVVAGSALIVLAPLFAVLVLVTRAAGAPMLYKQTRVGERGEPFTLYKIRTMACDAECGGATFCADDDARVTRVGRLLRRTHLDELPQLWNVLRGDMSIVGPRPERPEFVASLEAEIPFWSRRLLVKPGITGWAQLRSSYASDYEEMRQKLSYDLWYLKHRSLPLDLAICLATLRTVCHRVGSRE
jgi:exopolysaccharide biosynthesis polyprenyl glycosylphosphotransferase